MRIGTIGAGTMVEALCSRWARAGHEVMVGGRSRARAEAMATLLGAGTRSGGLREAVEFGQVVLLAVPGESAVEAVRSAGAGDGVFAGRVVVDCTNALTADAFAAPPGSFVPVVDAVGERVGREIPDAHVVKAFNVCAAEVWHDGARRFEGRTLAVPVCGDDLDAVAVVDSLVVDLGLHPVYAGGLARARLMEAMTAFVMGLWFAGEDARAMLPPLEAAHAVAD